jgi:hypothetical protein
MNEYLTTVNYQLCLPPPPPTPSQPSSKEQSKCPPYSPGKASLPPAQIVYSTRSSIKRKEELHHIITNKDTFSKILEQGAEADEVDGDIKDYLRENRGYMLDYFLRIKDKVNAEELRFY